MFNIGDHIIFAHPSTVERCLLDENWDAYDFWYDYTAYIVSEVNNDGSLHMYQDIQYYGEDANGMEYELDEPEGDGYNIIFNNESSNYFPYTKEMLVAIKNQPVNALDSVCKKVLYLYRKHNDNPNTNFKWSIT